MRLGAVRLEARLAGTAPAAQAQGSTSDRFWRITRGAAAAARGLYDAQLWVESTAALMAGGGARIGAGAFYGAVQLDLGLLYGMGARPLAQGAVEGGARVADWLELGVKLQSVWIAEQPESRRGVICIARSPQECGGEPSRFDGFMPVYSNGERALVEDVLVVSLVPGARLRFDPVQVGVDVPVNLTDLVAVGAGGGSGVGLILSVALLHD